MAHTWQVIVGNIGTVYDGTNGFAAVQAFNRYVAASKAPHGRAGGEDVTLMQGDEIHREHHGTQTDD